MGDIHWYKRDPEAALSGMMELDLFERGAYNSIIDLLYSRNGNVRDDDQFIAHAIGVNPRTWRRAKIALMKKGKVWVINGKIMANRVEKELKSARNFIENQRKNSAKRWERDQNPNKINDQAMPPHVAVSLTPTPTPTSLKKEGGDQSELIAAGKLYAWQGDVVRLTAPDLKKLQKRFPKLNGSFEAELAKADAYYRDHPPKGGKFWFPLTAWLTRASEQIPDATLFHKNGERRLNNPVAGSPEHQEMLRKAGAL